MIRSLSLTGILLVSGCSALATGKHCDLDAASRQQAMVNIQRALPGVPYIHPEQYLSDDFQTHGEFNARDHCVFLVKPWQPIVSEFLWDGTLAFRVDKQSLKVEHYFRVDEG